MSKYALESSNDGPSMEKLPPVSLQSIIRTMEPGSSAFMVQARDGSDLIVETKDDRTYVWGQ